MRKGPSRARLVRPDRRDPQEVEAGMAFMDAAAHRREVADFLKICTEMPRVEFNHRRDDAQEFDVRNEVVYNIDMYLSEEDKIRSFIINDLKWPTEKANILAPQWARALDSSPEPTLSLPQRAPEIYAERNGRPELGRKENPVEFLERVWGGYMRAGVLYQDDIKRLGDDKLVQAIRSYCQREKIRASEVLPPPGSRRATDLLQSVDDPELAKAAVRFADRQRKARFRENISVLRR